MPHSGEVTLAIIRSGPVTTHTMDIWERETRLIKEFMGVAFQTGYLVLLFGEGHPRRYEGQHSGTHVSYTLNFDVQDGSQRAEGYYIRLFHETSHYYWRHGGRWFNEGAATFMHKNVRFNEFSINRPDTTMHCIHADGLAKLERLNPVQTHDASRCNYSLGRQLSLD